MFFFTDLRHFTLKFIAFISAIEANFWLFLAHFVDLPITRLKVWLMYNVIKNKRK